MTEYQKALILERLADARTRRDKGRFLTAPNEYYTAAGECDALNYVCGVLGLRERPVTVEKEVTT